MPNCRRSSDERSRLSGFPAKRPHFFKIIDDSIIQDRKLGIPKTFVRKYGKNLADLALLKVPSGAEWRVELTRRDGQVWLQNGWQEFTEYYCIRRMHFLVFRYEGNSHFHVVIFNKSASEIEYPFNGTHSDEIPHLSEGCQVPKTEETEEEVSVEILDDVPPNQTSWEKTPLPHLRSRSDEVPHLSGDCQVPKKEETEEDVSVEILDDVPPRQTSWEKTPLPYLRSGRMVMRTNPTCKIENTTNLRASFPHLQVKGSHTNGILKLGKSTTNANSCRSTQDIGAKEEKEGCEGVPTTQRRPQSNVSDSKRGVTASETDKALQTAKAFEPENPFFRVRMQPSYVSKKSALNIPMRFGKKYFTGKRTNVILTASDGRTWTVRCCSSRAGKAKLSYGWNEFVRGNSLEKGDDCVFELIHGVEILLKVVIIRAVEVADRRLPVQKLEMS